MSIDEYFDLQPPKFFDDLAEGTAELRRILATTPDEETRDTLVGLIRQLEAGEVRATLFMSIFEDGSMQPIIIGGNAHERLEMVETIKLELATIVNRQLH